MRPSLQPTLGKRLPQNPPRMLLNPPFLHPILNSISPYLNPIYTPIYTLFSYFNPIHTFLFTPYFNPIHTLFDPIHTLTCNCPHNIMLLPYTLQKKNCSVCTNVYVALSALYNSCWPSTRPVCGNYKAIVMWSSSVPRFTGSYLITRTPTHKHTMKNPPNHQTPAWLPRQKMKKS